MPVNNVEARYTQRKNNLSPAEQRVGEFIFDNPSRAARMTIYELSEEIGVVKSTITKFSKKLGYRGFREFRNDLLSETFDQRTSIAPSVEPDDPAPTVFRKTFDTSIRVMSDAADTIDMAQFSYAVDILASAGTIGIFGIGGRSAAIAEFTHRQFSMLSLSTEYNGDFHSQLLIASELTEKDCAIVFSVSNDSGDVERIVDQLKEKSCKIIIVAVDPFANIVRSADCVLMLPTPSPNEETEYRALMAVQVTLAYALFSAMMYKSSANTSAFKSRIRSLEKIRS